MPICFAIGIGGTGSKCLEALLHSCAAGLGPQRLTAAMVDQDRANGNVARFTHGLELYQRLRRDLRGATADLGASRLFATALDVSGEPVWSPLPQKQVTLESHFGYSALQPKARLLFDALFEKERERTQPLDEGFRGRPAVGAAAMYSAAAAAAEEPGFWSNLFAELKDAGDTEIRICVFASIFGGTGASGFPTITRVIREEAKRHGAKVAVSGVLLLPYFMFPDPTKDADQNQVRARDFMATTQQALYYYHGLLTQAQKGLFNHLYLVGAERPFILDNLGPGANTQTNPALLPELLAAVAALQFFRYGARADDKTLLLRAGHRSGDASSEHEVTWDDIPRVDEAGDINDVRSGLASLARFSIAYLNVYRPCLAPDIGRAIARQPWFHRLVSKAGVALSDEHTQETLTTLASYCEAALRWSFELGQRRNADDLRSNLFQFDGLNTTAAGFATALNGDETAFDRLVPSPRARRLADVFYSISTEPPERNGKGLGVFLGQLFRGSRVQEALPK